MNVEYLFVICLKYFPKVPKLTHSHTHKPWVGKYACRDAVKYLSNGLKLIYTQYTHTQTGTHSHADTDTRGRHRVTRTKTTTIRSQKTKPSRQRAQKVPSLGLYTCVCVCVSILCMCLCVCIHMCGALSCFLHRSCLQLHMADSQCLHSQSTDYSPSLSPPHTLSLPLACSLVGSLSSSRRTKG